MPALRQISANFGTDLAARPFKGDLAWIKAEATQRLYASILHTPVPRGAKVRAGGAGVGVGG